jgi:DNA (cytosine-5)-methyltransferase 1
VNKQEVRHIELFAGIGGFRLGIERAFHILPQSPEEGGQQDVRSGASIEEGRTLPLPTCVFASEWDKHAAKTYNQNFGGEIDTRDIKSVPTTDIPDHDLLTGGFPCQSFSVAGKRLGFNETRGTLFFDIARILADKRPRHLVLENVKGLLTHDGGKTFQTILGVLADTGYRVEWQVLNSKSFGVAQNRERVYIVGHFRGECGRKIFPLTKTSGQDDETSGAERERGSWVSTLDARYGQRWSSETYVSDQRSKHGKSIKLQTISPTLQAHMGTGGNNVPVVTRQPLRFLNRNQKNIEGDYAFTVDASQTSGIRITEATTKGYAEANVGNSINLEAMNSKTRRGRVGKGVAQTLDTSMQQHTIDERTYRIRRLTPVECERLQGFPDRWCVGSDSQKYKQMGNAVTVNVVEAVITAMISEGCFE